MKKLSKDIMENFGQQQKLITDIDLTEKCINDKWLPICKGNYRGRGIIDCALCNEYYIRFNYAIGVGCDNCPISEDTGETLCGGTPYRIDAEDWVVHPYEPAQAEAKQQAYAELFYLHDLADSLRDQLKELQDEQL